MGFLLNNIPDVFITNLKLKYKHRWLFDQFSMQLPAATWTCLLGSSGVGKSTLLRLLAGLPTGADHPMDTQAITATDQKPLTGRIAYMAQQDSLMPWLTVVNNCLIGPRLRGETVNSAYSDRVLTLLARVGLTKAMDLYPAALSGGMRQRVSLVRTLLEDRPLVLMDEPFSALDAITRYKLQDLAAELLAGKTILLVTHDPLEALRLADRIYVLRGAPATLSSVLVPEGSRPRSLTEPCILRQQAELLTLLAELSN